MVQALGLLVLALAFAFVGGVAGAEGTGGVSGGLLSLPLPLPPPLVLVPLDFSELELLDCNENFLCYCYLVAEVTECLR